MPHDDRRCPFDRAHKLHSPERHQEHPPEPVVQALELQPDSQVLDLGVGTGFHAIPVARALGPAGRVLGVDIEPRMLELLKQRARDAGVAERIVPLGVDPQRPQRLPLDHDSVDRALLCCLYHELPDPAGSLAELARVLRPDGARLLIVDWPPEGRSDKGPPVDHRVPRARVTRTLAAAGFVPVEALPLYDDLYALRAGLNRR